MTFKKNKLHKVIHQLCSEGNTEQRRRILFSWQREGIASGWHRSEKNWLYNHLRVTKTRLASAHLRLQTRRSLTVWFFHCFAWYRWEKFGIAESNFPKQHCIGRSGFSCRLMQLRYSTCSRGYYSRHVRVCLLCWSSIVTEISDSFVF